jgi:hypothetical protein
MPHLLAKLSGRNGVGSINHIFSDIGILTMSEILKKIMPHNKLIKISEQRTIGSFISSVCRIIATVIIQP